MKKKFIALVALVFCLCLGLLTGCGLFEINRDRYLERTVAKVDDDIVITKEDLLLSYNQYAATLINSYGYTPEQAVEYVIDILINKEVMLRESKSLFPNLSDKEKSKLWHDTYDSVNEALATYEEEVRKDWDIAEEKEEEKEDNSYKPFDKQANISQNADGVWEVVDIEEEDELKDVVVIDGGADKFLSTYRTVTRQDVSDEALKRYIKDLKENEEGRKFEGENAYSDDAVLTRAINRVHDQLEENMYLTKLKKHLIDSTAVSADKVLDKYKELVLEDYNKYSVDPDAFAKDILESADGIYYVPEKYQGKFFYVSHFLIKFNEEEQTEVDDLKKQLEDGYITQAEYDAGVALITSNMKVNKVVDGEKTDEKITIAELMAALNSATAGKSEQEKAKIFNDYIYMYNEDTAFNNSEFGYVIGDNESKMVESFTNASRELHRPNDDDKSVLGKVGDLSAPVPSEYGVHFIMYCGEVENIFGITSSNVNEFNLVNADIKTLSDTLLYACNNKSVFDKVYADVFSDQYSIFESSYVKQLKQDLKIKIYKKSYKDLLG